MTDLSPAAQAVANAIEPLDWESGHCTYEDICFISRQVAATALRALGSQLGHEIMGVRVVDCSQIQLIAAELEGA